MNTQDKVFELLEATDLNWQVEKKPLVSEEGYDTESYGIFRKVMEDEEMIAKHWLGTVGNQYIPYQNYELATTILEACNGIGLEVEKGGHLKGGQKVYLQVKLPTEYIGKSDVKRWITATNSHNGSSSIGFGSTNKVVACENTFYKVHRDLSKFRHTKNSKERVIEAMKEMRTTLELDEMLVEGYKRMADLPLKDEIVARVIDSIFGVVKETPKDEISTRKKNQLIDFAQCLTTEAQLEGGTIWGLFNGVTRYTNHNLGANMDEDKRLDYLMNGTGNKINQKGYKECSKWVNENYKAFSIV